MTTLSNMFKIDDIILIKGNMHGPAVRDAWFGRARGSAVRDARHGLVGTRVRMDASTVRSRRMDWLYTG